MSQTPRAENICRLFWGTDCRKARLVSDLGGMGLRLHEMTGSRNRWFEPLPFGNQQQFKTNAYFHSTRFVPKIRARNRLCSPPSVLRCRKFPRFARRGRNSCHSAGGKGTCELPGAGFPLCRTKSGGIRVPSPCFSWSRRWLADTILNRLSFAQG